MHEGRPARACYDLPNMARLLVVDDEPNNLEVARVIAEAAGHVVVLAADGRQALDRLAEAAAPFDLMLVDVLMPVLDGIGFTRAVRGDARYAGVKILGVTAKASQADQSEMIAVGMDAILLKPFRRRDLLGAIERLIGERSGVSPV